MKMVVAAQAIVMLALTVLSTAGESSPDTPPPWPLKFSVNITTNRTWRLLPPSHPVAGKMYYNWGLQALRVDHGAGNFESCMFSLDGRDAR